MSFTSEAEPLESMKDLLKDSWKAYYEVKMPQIVIANDPNEPKLRAELNNGDLIILKMEGAEQLKQRANFMYYDRIFPMSIEIYTKVSRQRMRDLGKIIRMICNDNKHDFPRYQLIRYLGYDESVEANLNIWRYRFRLQLESNALCTESLT